MGSCVGHVACADACACVEQAHGPGGPELWQRPLLQRRATMPPPQKPRLPSSHSFPCHVRAPPRLAPHSPIGPEPVPLFLS